MFPNWACAEEVNKKRRTARRNIVFGRGTAIVERLVDAYAGRGGDGKKGRVLGEHSRREDTTRRSDERGSELTRSGDKTAFPSFNPILPPGPPARSCYRGSRFPFSHHSWTHSVSGSLHPIPSHPFTSIHPHVASTRCANRMASHSLHLLRPCSRPPLLPSFRTPSHNLTPSCRAYPQTRINQQPPRLRIQRWDQKHRHQRCRWRRPRRRRCGSRAI